MSQKSIPLADLEARERGLFSAIRRLKRDLERAAVQDILDKTHSILRLIPSPKISFIDQARTLIAVSRRQREDILNDRGIDLAQLDALSDQERKCFAAYCRFKSPCSWCRSLEAMQTREPVFSRGVVGAEARSLARPDPDLVFSDILAIPCGQKGPTGYSHCIEVVFPATEQHRKQQGHLQQRHTFIRALLRFATGALSSYDFHRIVLLGALFIAPDRRVLSADVYELSEEFESFAKFDVHRTVVLTEANKRIWDNILRTRSFGHGASGFGSIEIQSAKGSGTTLDLDISSRRLSSLRGGKPVVCCEGRRAVGYVQGDKSMEIPSFLLLLSKDQSDDIVAADDLHFLADYSLSCECVLQNIKASRQVQKTQKEKDFLLSVSDPNTQRARIASLLISLYHNVAHQWSSFLDCADLAVDRLPGSGPMRQVAATYKSSRESMKRFFSCVPRWQKIGSARIEKVDVCDLVDTILKRYTDRFAQMRITPPRISQSASTLNVSANREYLGEVFACLLDNALDALANTSMPRLTLSLSREDQNGQDMVCFVIRDNGCGIEDAYKESIWSQGFTTKGDKGTGEGLAFAKYAVERFGGKVSCRSTFGNGSEFILHLPLC